MRMMMAIAAVGYKAEEEMNYFCAITALSLGGLIAGRMSSLSPSPNLQNGYSNRVMMTHWTILNSELR
jgi:hypothetical protein